MNAKLREFLTALHPDDGWRDLRAGIYKNGRGGDQDFLYNRRFPTDKPEQVPEYVAQYPNCNIYVGVGCRAHSGGMGLKDCSSLWAVWVDIDFKTRAEQIAREALDAFPFPHNIRVHSGGGLQVYWLLREPVNLQDKDKAAHIKSVLKALAAALDADRDAAEPARILRVPGTLNIKYDPPRPVVLEHLNTEHRISLDDLIAHLGPLPRVEPEVEKPAIEHNYSIEDRLARARSWLAKQPPAIEKQGGDNHTFSICCSVAIGHDLPEDYALRVLTEWNARCQPPWSEDGLRTKLRNAIKHGDGPRGAKLKPESLLRFVKASDVKTRKLEWLWHARLPYGAIALLEGAPEKGKSTILADLAARVSRGNSFPGETTTREPGNVVMLVAEDDISATVVPRLRAAGADLERINILTLTKDEHGQIVPFHISDDHERLRASCEDMAAKFVAIDPLVSYLGSRKGRLLNTNNDLEVRKSLIPLKNLAESVGASVVAIRHYRKGKGIDALEAGGGSVAFAALVRVIIAALPNPEDPDKYLLAVAKNNLVARTKRPAFAYEIVPSVEPEIGRIAWGHAVDLSAREVLEAEASKGNEEGGKTKAARDFLQVFLTERGWILATAIFDAAAERGISKKTLERAKEKLPITSEKKGDVWCWRLRQQSDFVRDADSGPGA